MCQINYLLGKSSSDLLDRLLGVGLGEDDDGIELCVVQLVNGVGRDVQEGVLAAVHDLADGRDAGLDAAGTFAV